MLLVLFTWVVISFVLISFGDMFLRGYNLFCRSNDSYTLLDKLILGLVGLVIPLSAWSLWLPSNHYFLFLLLTISLLYWIVNRDSAKTIFADIRNKIAVLKLYQWCLFVFFLLLSLYMFSWEQYVFDSLFYHHENIRWNEDYSVVPGLANLDDRYGFNSNYFLLSAVFTFRFLLGSAVYTLQGLVVTAIMGWTIYELVRSNYEVKRLFLFFSCSILYWVYSMNNTSSDILPNFIAFYLIARVVLFADVLKTHRLFLAVLPAFLLTCKLSFIPFGFFSIYVLYTLFKSKRYREIAFISSCALLIIGLWMVRNVIISGYLVYPLYQIDLFSFDWKVPLTTAMKQKEYIWKIGVQFFKGAVRYPHASTHPLAVNLLTDLIYFLSAVSMISITLYIVKRSSYISEKAYLIYTIAFATILLWATAGPDVRFIGGALCGVILLGGCLQVLSKTIHLPRLSVLLLSAFACVMTFWVVNIVVTNKKETGRLDHRTLLRVYSYTEQFSDQGGDVDGEFKPYELNNGIVIYLNMGLSYDRLPSTIRDNHTKFLSLECLEARGSVLQDGFRAKQDCK